jgi:hypothetical protein
MSAEPSAEEMRHSWPWWSAWWHRWRVRRDPLGYMRTLAAKHDPVYEDAFRQACIDVMGEDPYAERYDG